MVPQTPQLARRARRAPSSTAAATRRPSGTALAPPPRARGRAAAAMPAKDPVVVRATRWPAMRGALEMFCAGFGTGRVCIVITLLLLGTVFNRFCMFLPTWEANPKVSAMAMRTAFPWLEPALCAVVAEIVGFAVELEELGTRMRATPKDPDRRQLRGHGGVLGGAVVARHVADVAGVAVGNLVQLCSVHTDHRFAHIGKRSIVAIVALPSRLGCLVHFLWREGPRRRNGRVQHAALGPLDAVLFFGDAACTWPHQVLGIKGEDGRLQACVRLRVVLRPRPAHAQDAAGAAALEATDWMVDAADDDAAAEAGRPVTIERDEPCILASALEGLLESLGPQSEGVLPDTGVAMEPD